MIKVHRIITGTTLLAVCGFMMIVWAHGSPAPTLTQASTDSVRAVKLRFTFASGDSANVTQVEGGTIKVERDGKKLTITPYMRDHFRRNVLRYDLCRYADLRLLRLYGLRALRAPLV